MAYKSISLSFALSYSFIQATNAYIKFFEAVGIITPLFKMLMCSLGTVYRILKQPI